MNRGREDGYMPPIGLSTVIVIFAVLCLLTFALLTVSTVQADSRLRNETEQAMLDYYAAETEAEEILARLRAGEELPEVKAENGICSYICPISDVQVLEVAVEIKDNEYHILRWQAVSTADWTAEKRLEVWDGTEGEVQP